MTNVNPGFDAHRLLTVTVSLNPRTNRTDENRVVHTRQILDALRRVPGVEAASVINHVPLTGDSDIRTARVSRKGTMTAFSDVEYRVVDPDYFRTMKVPVYAGSIFREGERRRVAVINRLMATTIWPGQDAIGQQFGDGDNPPVTVIGVVGDIHNGSLESPPGMQFYVPLEADPWADNYMIRTRSDPMAMLPLIQQTVWRLDPEQPVSHPQTMERLVAASTLDRRFETGLIAGFATAALLLAALGLFGVASLSVARRTREFGVRLALGARASDLLRLELARTLVMVTIGLAAGLAVSLALGRAVASLLYGVAPWSPLVYGAAIIVLAIPARAAAMIPARRAARVDAATALRAE